MSRRLVSAFFWGTLAVFLIQNSASAQMLSLCQNGNFGGSICQVSRLSDSIAGIVSAMTDVAIIPMGMGAAMKTFRHIVLNNV